MHEEVVATPEVQPWLHQLAADLRLFADRLGASPAGSPRWDENKILRNAGLNVGSIEEA